LAAKERQDKRVKTAEALMRYMKNVMLSSRIL